MSFASQIFKGKVFHKRFKPKEHRLDYRICSFLFDLDEIPTLNQDLKVFSHNKRNLISFWDKDHGDGSGQPLRPYVEGVLHKAGIDLQGGSIRLLCYPRLFGYAFNPLSVYYCYHADETLKAVIYEVSNTFGQRHSYVIPLEDHAGPEAVIEQSCEKGFYVSPFMAVEGRYHFRLQAPSQRLALTITQTDAEDDLLLKASFSGVAQEMTDRSLVSMLLRYPLMTVKVIVGIHWEALHIWRKGIKVTKRPPAPDHPYTLVRPAPLKIALEMETNP